MTVLPVVARELREASRHAFTYNLRVLGAAAALLAMGFFGLTQDLRQNAGGELFQSLHFTLFFSIWILVPALTADCISRERREGTLGLLCLTALRPGDIVVAKGLAGGLRALSLWLAVLPVAIVPFLLGGISWADVAMSVTFNFSSICLALTAGLVASAWCKSRLRALAIAMGMAFCLLLALGVATGLIMLVVFGTTGWTPGSLSIENNLGYGLGFLTGALSSRSRFLGTVALATLLRTLAQVVMISLLALGLGIALAGDRIRKVWRDQPPSPRQIWLRETFCTPIVWRSYFRRWLQRRLERNPIGWLEQRTWSGRLVTWAWFAVVVSLYSAIFTDRNFFRSYSGLQRIIAWLMVGSMAMTAAGSFRRERELGVMELLLVSPLSETAIIWGRLRGLWTQFLPAFGLLQGIWTYFLTFLPHRNDPLAILFFAATFATLPVIGLYFSLRCRGYVTAFVASLAVGLFVPGVFPSLFAWWWHSWTRGVAYYSGEMHLSLGVILLQFVFAAMCGERLYTRLKRRAFPLEQGERA